MVHYNPPILFAAQRPSPLCPKCGSHRTEIIGVCRKIRRRRSSVAAPAARISECRRRTRSTRAGELSFRSDIRASAFVRRGDRRRRRRRPGDRDLRAPRSTARRSVVAARRRARARRQDPRQRRIALQRHQHDGHRARFLGRQAVGDPPRAARLSGRRHRRVLPRDRRQPARGSRRQAVSRHQSRARRARRAAARERRVGAHARAPDIACRRRRSRPTDGGFRIDTDRGAIARAGGRPRDRRPVAAEERQRRRRLRDRPRLGHTIVPTTPALAPLAARRRPTPSTPSSPASRRTSSSPSGSTAPSPSA